MMRMIIVMGQNKIAAWMVSLQGILRAVEDEIKEMKQKQYKPCRIAMMGSE